MRFVPIGLNPDPVSGVVEEIASSSVLHVGRSEELQP
jgi:hypothetical protein